MIRFLMAFANFPYKPVGGRRAGRGEKRTPALFPPASGWKTEDCIYAQADILL